MSKEKKDLIISFVKSFLGNAITYLALAISVLPEGTITNPDFYKAGGFISLLGAVVRSALSETWKKTAPVSIGGVKKRRD